MVDVKVELGPRSYDVFIGSGLMRSKEVFSSVIQAKKALIVTNKTIAPLYLDELGKMMDVLKVDFITHLIEDGEKYKNADTLNQIYNCLIKNNLDRFSPIIALGGGVVGDVAGFAAATYQRGVPFVQVPTTLLAQVDSSVGGKTAINHQLGKNMIGAFYQPKAVIIDVRTLSSLPKRQLSAGLAEVIKYGIIRDATFFSWLENNLEYLLAGNLDNLPYAIEKSCRIKAQIVSQDEKEVGSRALLNFGHTFGHAIEAATGYSQFLHGEAVAMGSILASMMSEAMGFISADTLNRIKNIFLQAGLPITPPNLGLDSYLELMRRDKKVQNGKIRLILLRDIGEAFVADEYDTNKLNDVLSLEKNDA